MATPLIGGLVPFTATVSLNSGEASSDGPGDARLPLPGRGRARARRDDLVPRVYQPVDTLRHLAGAAEY